MGYSPHKSQYFNPNIEYVFNRDLTEYDMRDAGYAIIKHYGLLDANTIKELSALDKMERTIAIGKLRGKDKDLSKLLTDKFAEMRSLFVSANRLSDSNIISVKNDAIYTIGECSKLKFGQVEFVPKNKYSSYIRFTDNMNIEVYYSSGGLDVKGIGEVGLNRHRLYTLAFLSKVIYYLESKNPSLKRYLRTFIDEYKGMKLDDEYYIEFNNMSSMYNPIYNYQKMLIPLIQISLREMT